MKTERLPWGSTMASCDIIFNERHNDDDTLPLIPALYSMEWRGHQTFPIVVSLKGRLPQKLQCKFTLSCEIVQIHSLFRHGFIKTVKSKFYLKRK